MAYEVTATRRRPQRFEDLVGQEFVAETFRNSIQSKKIAHAYLFSGPRGCGKTSTARILAKALNCNEGPTATPCGHCQQCLEITKGSCTDVIEIDGASNTSVNDVREIKDEVLFPPQSCRYKIYIIDEVHMLSTSAFNALLKTIEEPPPYVIFIFATTELQKVPATIKSRCQQFNFRLVPIEKVKEQLALASQEISVKAEEEALYWIAKESTGSMRDAYTLFDQVAAFSGNEITYDKIKDKLGLIGVDSLNEIFDDCANNKTQAALEKLDSFLQSGISIEQLISNSTDYLRSLLLIKNGITRESLLGQSSERYSQTVLSKWNPIQIERAVSIFLQLYRDIRYSLNPRYELELAFSRLSWLSDYVSPAEVKVAIDKAKSLLENGETQNTITAENSNFNKGGAEPPQQTEVYNSQEYQYSENIDEPSDVSSSLFSENINSTVDLSNPNELKKAVLRELAINDPILGTTLMQTSDWILENSTIKTSVMSSFTQASLQNNIKNICAIISKHANKELSFEVSVKKMEVKNNLEDVPESVKKFCDTFKGEIISFGESENNTNQQKNIDSDNTDSNLQNNENITPEE